MLGESLDPRDLVEFSVAMLAVAGNLYVAHKRVAGLWMWLVANLIACPFMLSLGLYGMAIQYAVFTATTMYSIVKWRQRPAV